jgi:hypothetical protein
MRRWLLDPGVPVAIPRTWHDLFERDLDLEARAWVEEGCLLVSWVPKV